MAVLAAKFLRPDAQPVLSENSGDAHGWWRRAGGGSSGGARGGGSSSSGGARGGGGSPGRSGSSGSGSSGGGVSGGRPGASQPKTVSSGSLPAAQRGPIYSAPRTTSTYGYGRPGPGATPLLYGFWPLSWYTDVPDGAPASNASRPGGALLGAGLQAPNDNATSYVVYGDAQSLDAVFPLLGQNCSATNATVPADLGANQTLQLYREDSFALYRFAGADAPANASFENCVNQTIGNNLLVAPAQGLVAPLALACLVAACLGLKLS